MDKRKKQLLHNFINFLLIFNTLVNLVNVFNELIYCYFLLFITNVQILSWLIKISLFLNYYIIKVYDAYDTLLKMIKHVFTESNSHLNSENKFKNMKR